MASLSVDQTEVVLKAPTVEVHIPRDQILGIRIKNRFLYKGVVIEHSLQDAPEVLIFWTRSGDEIAGILSPSPLPDSS